MNTFLTIVKNWANRFTLKVMNAVGFTPEETQKVAAAMEAKNEAEAIADEKVKQHLTLFKGLRLIAVIAVIFLAIKYVLPWIQRFIRQSK